MGAPVAVRFERVTKRFPGTQALTDVTLEVAAGSCHALCGENGAGKSTLGKILAGVHRPDVGQMIVFGETRRFAGPRDALHAGVGMVYQEPSLCANLSVAENLTLGTLPRRSGFVDRAEMFRRAIAMLAQIGAELDVRRPLGALNVAQQQLVQIATAVGSRARVIVFDEPTSSLSQVDADRLYALIERLRAEGVACIYVSHRLPEVFHLCDTISVLRDGRHVATHPRADLDENGLVRLMIGRPLTQYFAKPADASAEPGAEVLRVQGLSSPGKLHDVSFAVRKGEILGLAGLVGAGRSELAAALFGLDPHARGEIMVQGQRTRIGGPSAAIAMGIGLVPEDRQRQGIIPRESVLHNASLAILERLSRLTWIRRALERAQMGEVLGRLRLRAASLDTEVARLSGGNQQKVVLARWLASGARLLILDEPTRGVDVGAKAEIHALIGALAAQGTAILLISSELPEVLSLSTRILVLRGGRQVAEVAAAGATQDMLLRFMAGIGEMPATAH